jgi:NAD(P)H-dependent flavin oxidoreductase YrpB (nitropropane dioxygenase family)
MLRNDWTEAWAAEDTPDPLGMPLQNMVTMDAIVRTSRYASSPASQNVAFSPVGQVVGMMNEVQSVRDLITHLVEDYVDAVDRLNGLQPE